MSARRRQRQEDWRRSAGPAWQGATLVLSTRLGTPVEPRNFHRDFKARCEKAGVRPISVHSTNVCSEVSSAETRTALRRLGEQLQGG